MATKNPKVEAAIERLKAFYQLGKEAAAETLGDGQNRKLAAFAQDQGCSVAHVHNAIRFATLYDAVAIKSLYTKMRATHAALGIGHIRELIQVPKTAERKRLQEEALKHLWSVRQLQTMRLARFPASRKQDRKSERRRGRLPRRPATVQEAYATLADRAQQIITLDQVIRNTPEGERSLTLKPAIQTELTKAIGSLTRLSNAIWGTKRGKEAALHQSEPKRAAKRSVRKTR